MGNPIMYRTWLSVAVVLWLTLKTRVEGQQSQNKPNVLYIITDQQRFDAIHRVQEELDGYKDKIKIRTPNLDRLSRDGAFFRNAYTQCPVCGPARASMRTGCTIERTGVQTNPLSDSQNRLNPKLFQDKIDALEGLDQILVEDYGYLSEYYGKWHIPDQLSYTRNGSSLATQYNDYNYFDDTFTFRNNSFARKLRKFLGDFATRGYINKTFEPGQQEDTYSRYPYIPITLDSRFSMPTNTRIENFTSFNASQNSQMGNYTLSKNYSASYFNHDVAMRSLTRLAAQEKPFILTVSYHSPHPPYMAAYEYLEYYWSRRHRLFLPPNVGIPLDDSISYYSQSENADLKEAGFCEPDKIQELTAVYYALVEEIDTLVGIMLDRLDELDIADNTIVVYTSDHGEALGANCLRGKSTFYENAVHVPLLIKYPNNIPAGTVVDEAVSLIDVFSTILDYTGTSVSDTSNGMTLRGFIEGSNFNFFFDELAAIAEWDFREPENAQNLSRSLVSRPNFMIRHRQYKLLMHKQASSNKEDWLLDVESDPYEMVNLIKTTGQYSDITIGKAEHLRYLLLEWMRRVESKTNNDFYSNPIYNAEEGNKGDIQEILDRQSWRPTDFWVSDYYLKFNKARRNGVNFVRHEWLYIGRRTPGTLNLTNLTLYGEDAGLFRISKSDATIESLGVLRLKVTYAAEILPKDMQSIDAFVRIEHNAGPTRYVPLLLPNNLLPDPPTLAPSTSTMPSDQPSVQASEQPSVLPSEGPVLLKQPSEQPSVIPSITASHAPSDVPSTSTPSTSFPPSTSPPSTSSSPSTSPSTPSASPSQPPSASPSQPPSASTSPVVPKTVSTSDLPTLQLSASPTSFVAGRSPSSPNPTELSSAAAAATVGCLCSWIFAAMLCSFQ